MLCPLLMPPAAALPSLSYTFHPCSAAAHVVREALKWKVKDAEAVDALHAAAPQLVAVHQQLQGQPDGVPGGWCGCAPGGVKTGDSDLMWGVRVLSGAVELGGLACPACWLTSPAPLPCAALHCYAYPAAPEELRVQLGRCIRQLKQLWSAGCVVAALLHASPGATAGQADGEQQPAAALSNGSAGGEADEAGTQRRWAWLVGDGGGGAVGLLLQRLASAADLRHTPCRWLFSLLQKIGSPCCRPPIINPCLSLASSLSPAGWPSARLCWMPPPRTASPTAGSGSRCWMGSRWAAGGRGGWVCVCCSMRASCRGCRRAVGVVSSVMQKREEPTHHLLTHRALRWCLPACAQVMAAVGMRSGGPALGRLMEAAVDWQLAHPEGSADECRSWLQREHSSVPAAE